MKAPPPSTQHSHAVEDSAYIVQFPTDRIEVTQDHEPLQLEGNVTQPLALLDAQIVASVDQKKPRLSNMTPLQLILDNLRLQVAKTQGKFLALPSEKDIESVVNHLTFLPRQTTSVECMYETVCDVFNMITHNRSLMPWDEIMIKHAIVDALLRRQIINEECSQGLHSRIDESAEESQVS